MPKTQRPHKNSEIDIVTALHLVLEAGNFDPAAQDVLQRAITEIETLRDIADGLSQTIDELTSQLLEDHPELEE